EDTAVSRVRLRSAVYTTARIGDAGEPCGIPFVTGAISSFCPSRHIAVRRLERKEAVHLTSGSGRRN
ncbi:hypothetical protein K474DRAFT_1649569, partial [Panus rudis PR-1116 ss-1]